MAASLSLRGRRAGGEPDPILQAQDRLRRGVKDGRKGAAKREGSDGVGGAGDVGAKGPKRQGQVQREFLPSARSPSQAMRNPPFSPPPRSHLAFSPHRELCPVRAVDLSSALSGMHAAGGLEPRGRQGRLAGGVAASHK